MGWCSPFLYLPTYLNCVSAKADQVQAAQQGLDSYFDFYNHRRPHQSLGYAIPAAVYFDELGAAL